MEEQRQKTYEHQEQRKRNEEQSKKTQEQQELSKIIKEKCQKQLAAAGTELEN